MTERLRPLLNALSVAQLNFTGRESTTEFRNVTDEAMGTFQRVLADAHVSKDEKLTCVSLMLDSEDPPDILHFVAWSQDQATTARNAVLKSLYALVKQHRNGPYLRDFQRGLFLAVWEMAKFDFLPSQKKSGAQVSLLRVFTCLAKGDPGLLQELVPRHAIYDANADKGAKEEEVRVLDQFLRLFSMCAGRAPPSSKAQLLKTAATILRQRLSSPLPHEEAQSLRSTAGYAMDLADKDLVKFLDMNAKQGKPGFDDLVSAGMSAIAHLLRFLEGPYDQNKNKTRLYGHVKLLLTLFAMPKVDGVGPVKHYNSVAKALRLVEEHASFFEASIRTDALELHDLLVRVLSKLSGINNEALDKHALPAVESVLRELARACQRVGASEEPRSTLVDHYRQALDTAPTDRGEALRIVRGVSAFASLLTDPQDQDGALLSRLISFSDRVLSDYEAGKASVYAPMLFPVRWRAAVLEATVSILSPPPGRGSSSSPPPPGRGSSSSSGPRDGVTVSDTTVDWMAALAVELIVQYYSLPKERPKVERALALALSLVQQPLLDRLTQPALTRAITREDVLDLEAGQKQATAYAAMWRRVISSLQHMNKGSALGSLLQEAMSTLQQLKLDYDFRPPPGDAEGAEVIVPQVPMDHEVFLSLVDFLEALLQGFMPQAQATWAPLLAPELVRRSALAPHVSGFYRLLSVVFQDLEATDALAPQSTVLSSGDVDALSRLLTCYMHRVIGQLDQYQDELLCSALSMVLLTPCAIADLPRLLPALRLALTTGVAHLPSATAAAEAMERWMSRRELARPLEASLPGVLPLLDLYLRDASQKGGVAAESRAEKEAFQRRVLRLLGRLGGRNQCLVEETGRSLEESLSWDPHSSVQLDVHFDFGDVRTLKMELGTLLPRLLQLAERKGDEQVKVLSAECLHATVLYMVGKSANESDSASATSTAAKNYAQVYSRLFPTLLRLALDPNPVTRQLFQSLLPQLIHWFARSRANHPETAALVDSLADGLSSSESGPVRSFCAGAIGEFVKYAIKQQSKKQMQHSPVTVGNLLTSIERLARHPSRYKRLGGAMALQHVLRHLREETSLIDAYILSLLHTAMTSLRASQADASGFGTLPLLGRLIDGIVKVIERKLPPSGEDQCALLVKKEARGPPVDVGEAVAMAWEAAGAAESAYRAKAMQVAVRLCHVLPDFRSQPTPAKAFRQWLLQLPHGQRDVLRVVEAPAASAIMGLGAGEAGFGQLEAAVDSLSAALDAYRWLFSSDILHAKHFFEDKEAFEHLTGKGAGRSSSGKRKADDEGEAGSDHTPRILPCLHTAMTKLWCPSPLHYEASLSILSPDARRLRGKNATCLCMALELMCLLLDKDSAFFSHRLVAAGLWSEPVQLLILQSMVAPWEGRRMNRPEEDDDVALHLPAVTRRLLLSWRVLDESVSSSSVAGPRFIDTARRFFHLDNKPTDGEGPPSAMGRDPYRLCEGLSSSSELTGKAWLIQACHTLHETSLLPLLLSPSSSEARQGPASLARHLLESLISTTSASLPPPARRLAGSILTLAVKIGLPLTGPGSLLSSVCEHEALYRDFSREVSEAVLGSRGLEALLPDLAAAGPDRPQEQAVFLGVVGHLLKGPTVMREAEVQATVTLAAKGGGLLRCTEDLDSDPARMQALGLLLRLLRLEALLPPSKRGPIKNDSRVRSAVSLVLRGKDTAVAAKGQALGLLPYLLTGPESLGTAAVSSSSGDADLVGAVDEMILQHFPYESRELLDKGTSLARREDTDYRLLLRALLLDSLAKSASPILLIRTVHHFNEGSHHRYYTLLRIALERVGALAAAAGEAGAMGLSRVLLVEVLQGRMKYPKKALLLQDALLPLLSSLPLPTFTAILSQPWPPADVTSASHAGTTKPLLVALLDTITPPLEPYASRLTDEALMARTTAMDVLCLCLTRYSTADIKAHLKPVLGDRGMVKDLGRAAASAVRLPVAAKGSESPEVRLRFGVSAYNAGIALVRATAKEAGPIVTFGFRVDDEDRSPGSFWSAIVDLSIRYRFKVGDAEWTNRLLPTTGGGRGAMSGFSFMIGGTQTWGGSAAGSLLGGGSFMMMNSSLSQLGSQAGGLSQRPAGDRAAKGGGEDEDGGEQADEAALDDDVAPTGPPALSSEFIGLRSLQDLNRQPAMAAVLAAIRQATELSTSGQELSATGALSSSPPPHWLSHLLTVLRDTHAPANVRLFLLQVLLNHPASTIAAPWCHKLAPVVMEVVMQEVVPRSKLKDGDDPSFDYMTTDVCDLLTREWSAFRPRDEHSKSVCTTFVAHLMGVAHHHSLPIARRNLGYLQALLSLWFHGNEGMVARLSDELHREGSALERITELLDTQEEARGGAHQASTSKGTISVRRRQVACNVLALIVWTGVNVLSERGEEQAKRLLRLLQAALQATSSVVYSVGSEACGAILASLYHKPKDQTPQAVGKDGKVELSMVDGVCSAAKTLLDDVQKLLRATIQETSTDVKHRNKGLVLVQGVHKHFPQIFVAGSGRLGRDLFLETLTATREIKGERGKILSGALQMLAKGPVPADIHLFQDVRDALLSFLTDTTRQCVGRRVWKPFVQLSALRLLRQLVVALSPAELISTLRLHLLKDGAAHSLTQLASSRATDTECREEVFGLLMEVFDRVEPGGDCADLEGAQGVRERVRSCLVRGLSDPDDRGLDANDAAATPAAASATSTSPEAKTAAKPSSSSSSSTSSLAPPVVKGIRRRVLDFWDQRGLSPTPQQHQQEEPLNRLHALLYLLFQRDCPGVLLPVSSTLLLALSLRAHASQAQLFDRPLDECDFQDLDLARAALSASSSSSLTGARSLTMAPLFSILRSQAMSQEGGGGMAYGTQTVDVSQIQHGMIRATQVSDWTQTQAAGGGGFMMMEEDGAVPASQAAPRDTTLLIDVASDRAGTGAATGAMLPPPPRGMKRRRPSEAMEDEAPPELGVGRPKRKRVVLYRRYRAGELPDVQIPRADLLRPLAGLCLRDGAIARSVFTGLFSPLYESAAEEKKAELVVLLRSALEGAADSTDMVAGLTEAYRQVMRVLGRSSSSSSSRQQLLLVPSTIAEAGLRSSNYHAAVVALEEQILLQTQQPASGGRRGSGGGSASKRRGGAEEESAAVRQDTWLQLSRLYRALGEKDVLLGLTERASSDVSQLASRPPDGLSTRKALELELEGQVSEAKEAYEVLGMWYDEVKADGEVQLSTQEVEAWESRRRECMARLGEWAEIMDAVDRGCGGRVDELLDGQLAAEAEEDLLPLYAEAVLRRYPEDSSKMGHALANMARRVQASPLSTQVVERSLPWALPTAHVFLDDKPRAMAALHRAYARFIEVWSGLHPCAESARKEQLEPLQYLVQLEDYLTDDRPWPLLERWSSHLPCVDRDPPHLWSSLGMMQNYAFKKVQEPMDGERWRAAVLRHSIRLCVSGAASSVSRSDLPWTRRFWRELTQTGRYYNSLKEAVGEENMTDVWVEQVDMFYRLQRLIAEDKARQHAPPSDMAAALVVGYGLKEADRALKAGFLQASGRAVALRVRAQSFQDMYNTLQGCGEDVAAAIADRYHSRYLAKSDAKADVPDRPAMLSACLTTAYDSYQSAMKELESAMPSTQEEGQGGGGGADAGDLAEQFARFCDTVLSSDDAGKLSSSSASSSSALAVSAVSGYIQALSHRPGAFPVAVARLLDLLHHHHDARTAFAEKADQVPSWLFLPWCPQLLTTLGAVEQPVTLPLLERMATDYPQALFYPYHMSKESFDDKALSATARLASIMEGSAPGLLKLVEALGYLVQPEIQVHQLTSRVNRLLARGEVEEARRVFQRFRQLCVPTARSEMGRVWRKFVDGRQAKAAQLDEMLWGKDGEKLTLATVKQLNKERKLRALCETASVARGGKQPLRDFSIWLDQYQLVTGSAVKLEVPGQYMGMLTRPPRAELHAHIARVDPEVLVLASKQLPKRVTFHGDDERDYVFLVKGGEDVRVDARVQQLFDVMNQAMRHDPHCRKARLACRTYKVVPVTSSLGLIEWVSDTAVLRDVVLDSLVTNHNHDSSKGSRGKDDGKAVWDETLVAFLKLYPQDRAGPVSYLKGFKDIPRDRMVRDFTALQDRLPRDLLRRYLLLLSSAPEAFVTLRAEFCRSLAAFSACSYILGIGDRHLQNFLLDNKTGALVGIDFGVAFGMGASALPVPELIPFRLTRQLTSVMEPLDAVGLLKTGLCHAMRALRGHKDLLLNTMEIYLKEPVVDWVASTRAEIESIDKLSQASATGGPSAVTAASSLATVSWEPARKVLLARDKLVGVDPLSILMADLSTNNFCKKDEALMAALRKTIKGPEDRGRGAIVASHEQAMEGEGKKRAGRTDVTPVVLSVTEQVDCLVDLATDPDVLGRSYVGLSTWV